MVKRPEVKKLCTNYGITDDHIGVIKELIIGKEEVSVCWSIIWLSVYYHHAPMVYYPAHWTKCQKLNNYHAKHKKYLSKRQYLMAECVGQVVHNYACIVI